MEDGREIVKDSISHTTSLPLYRRTLSHVVTCRQTERLATALARSKRWAAPAVNGTVQSSSSPSHHIQSPKVVPINIKMSYVAFVLLSALIAHATCRIHARQRSATPAASSAWQIVPSTQPKPDNTYSNGAAWRQGLPEDNSAPVPEIFNARDIDIPFRRLQQGKLMYFQEGELNQPGQITDILSPDQYDFANQSACGIPDSAFFQSKVAIHPYWLKYAPDGLGLNRRHDLLFPPLSLPNWSELHHVQLNPFPFACVIKGMPADLEAHQLKQTGYCMQDVCINFIRNDWQNDMINKVTDICCTDVNDPSCCHTPNDIKIDRTKALVLYGYSGKQPKDVPALSGAKYPEPANWIFSKCWAEAIVQPAYADNWWSDPLMPADQKWQAQQDTAQHANNQQTYPAKGWATYPMGGYMGRDPQSITDWQQGDPTPPWTPVAGGKGFGGSSAGSGGGATAAGNKTSADAGVDGPNGGGVQAVSNSSGNIISPMF